MYLAADSPAVLITTSQRVADEVLARIPPMLEDLKAEQPNTAAEVAWRDYGEIILAGDREEMCALSNQYAFEHVQVRFIVYTECA